MLSIKLIFFVLVITLIKGVPIDERKNSNRNTPSTRRATLETYRYNHPPSISIPVSVVFEENETGNYNSGKSLKLNTETPNKKPLPSQVPSSVAIPVSVVFEEETSGSDKSGKSKKLDSKISDRNDISSQKPSSEAIPVLVVFEQKESQNNKTLTFEKQTPEIILKKTTTSNENLSVPVAVIFEEQGITKNNALKTENLSPSENNLNNQANTKETKNTGQRTEPIILTSTELVTLENDIEVPTTNTSSAEPKQKENQSNVILKPQPKQYHQLEYQIPVAVVYEEPINVVQTSRTLNNSKEKLRGRNSRGRRPISTSTTEPTVEVKTAEDDTQKKPLKSEVKPNTSRRRHQVKQTQENSSDTEDIPVIIKFTESENRNIQPKLRSEKPSTTPVPKSETSSKKLTNNTRTPLQTQNRDSSFKAQKTEERKQDNESARKRQRDPVVPIIKSDIHAYGNSGSFSYSYEGGDGTKAFEKGELKTFKNDKTGEAVVGGFSYKDKDGTDISLSYTADENGYRPVGDHLPTPPPIPVAIQRALDYLATKTTPEPVTEAGEA